MERLLTIKGQVYVVLEKYEQARNNDRFLIFKLLELFYGVKHNIPKHDFIYGDFPSFESITRARRSLQAEGLFLSEDDVQEKRNSLQDDYIQAF